ncbi:MAG: hypothetical protein JNM93_06920, partial [Bacteriovoracaceae bacterium]|nr:hypothetical protein [Bacteriovoracaceae bacterium]
MRKTILKTELKIIITLAAINALHYLLGDYFSDNLFRISQASSSINFFSYHFSSFLAFVNYFTGQWTIPWGLTYAVAYIAIFSRRNDISDVIMPLYMIISFVGISYFVFPDSLGAGIYFLIKSYLNSVILLMVTLLCLGFSVYVCAKDSFKKTVAAVTELFETWVDFFKLLKRFYDASAELVRNRVTLPKFKKHYFIEKRIDKILRGENKAPAPAAVQIAQGPTWQPIKEEVEAMVDENNEGAITAEQEIKKPIKKKKIDKT